MTGVVISAGIITFVTATMVTACVILKKKCGKREHKDSPQHTYESIPLPTKGSQVEHGIQEEPDRTTSIVDKTTEDETVKYDDLVSSQNVQKSCSDIHLRANEAYTPSAEPIATCSDIHVKANEAYTSINISAEPIASTDI